MSDHSNDSVDDRQQPDDLPVPTGDAEAMPSLDELAVIANREGALVESAIDDARAAMSRGLVHAIAAGGALTEAKRQVPDGHWMDWVATNIDYSLGVVGTFMRFHRYEEHLLASPTPLTVRSAAAYIVGLPRMQNFGNTKVKLTPEVKTQIKAMHGSGATYHEIGECLGIAWSSVKKELDPEYRKLCMEANRRYRQKKRAAQRALARQERDAAVAATGGEPAAAYASLRKAIAAIDKAVDGSTDAEEREELRAAMSAMHKAEDAIVRALRIGRREAA